LRGNPGLSSLIPSGYYGLLLEVADLWGMGERNDMKYDRFEKLPVWNTVLELAERVYRITRHGFFVQPGDLRNQLRRTALSVSNNIAEGFERGSTAELLAFLYF
jgi:hypothetical protein